MKYGAIPHRKLTTLASFKSVMAFSSSVQVPRGAWFRSHQTNFDIKKRKNIVENRKQIKALEFGKPR